MKKWILISATAAAALVGSVSAFAQDRDGGGRENWGHEDRGSEDRGRDRGGYPGVELAGPGVPFLLPELRDTPRGRAFVMHNFDFNHDGIIDIREARAADHAFEADGRPDRHRSDWGGRDRDFSPPPPRPMSDGPGWDRRAMHDYGFRQTPRGASFNLSEDVLFATDSAVLRPGAIEKLRPLVRYLQNQPGVRVAIDGYTDSRGGAGHNQVLSENRAASVRNALAGMGVVEVRFQITGHGSRDPIASNATPEGMHQNRRVEVTLLGQRAPDF